MSHPQSPEYQWHPDGPMGQAPKNGLGVAALVLGLIGLIVGFFMVTFGVALALGVLGLIFGLVALGRVRKRIATNKGVAIAGTILSLASIVIGIIGAVVTFNAVDDAVSSLSTTSPGPTGVTGSDPAASPAEANDVANLKCDVTDSTNWTKASFTVTNSADRAKTYIVQVEWTDATGKRLAEGTGTTSSLAPGQAVDLDASALTELPAGTACKVFDVTSF